MPKRLEAELAILSKGFRAEAWHASVYYGQSCSTRLLTSQGEAVAGSSQSWRVTTCRTALLRSDGYGFGALHAEGGSHQRGQSTGT